MEEVRIVDTTLRDGDISLWAYGMTTGMMLPALRHMDEAGFDSMEFFLSLRFKKFVREHKEDPWDWLRLGTKEIKKTRLRYHGGLHSGFEFIPECIRRLVISTVAKYGIDLTRTSNAWNNFELLGEEAIELKKLGMDTVMNLIYSISPRHTDEYYARKARDAAALKPYRICFKDVGGMLTPERTRTLVRLIKQNIGDYARSSFTPIATTAWRRLTCSKRSRKACASSIRRFHRWPTALPSRRFLTSSATCAPWVTSHRSIPRCCRRCASIFRASPARKASHWRAAGIRSSLVRPSGAGRHDFQPAPSAETHGQRGKTCRGARRDRSGARRMGYPIMVTPFAQFVGSQAAINVIVGERYKEVDRSGDSIRARPVGQGGCRLHGPGRERRRSSTVRAPGKSPRWQHPEPSLAEVRKQYGGAHLSDEELLLRYYAGPEFVDALKNAPPRKLYLNARKPLLRLIEELGKKKLAHVYIRKGDFSLTMRN